MTRTNFKELLEAGVHFGHLKSKWNPAMAPYVFMERKGIHVIDLNKTVAMIEEASSALKQIAISGKKILFVATKSLLKGKPIFFAIYPEKTSPKFPVGTEKLIF